ncbi:MAG: shikimate dehydrogenase [Devosiaceae bacterium]|nr:shikimate dehydrogenase [Devosiaceae bacterium MH13]
MTLRAAVLGWPIGHSRSPLIHGHWIKEHGLDASYEPIAVDPEGASAWFRAFKTHGLVGANVTIPHKELALEACDTAEDHARRLGAVNTIWLEGDRLCGTSTDGAGFMANLDQTAPNWRDHKAAETALVLGAGGAARAILDALLTAGVGHILIANRTEAKAQGLADWFAPAYPSAKITAVSLAETDNVAGQAGLVVNTTALGMEGQPPLTLDVGRLAPDTTVTDIVYTPLETPLLAAAKAAGHPVVDGLGMLLHQAVPGFERWFGVRPTVTEAVRRVALRDLGVLT